MKNVGIFFASSIREFEEDRDKLYRHIGVINDLYKNRLNIKPEMCEDMSNRFTVERKQNEYNEIIRSCDYFYMLVGRHLGKFSREEFEVAWEHFKKTKKNPRIHAYLSDVDDRDETVTAFLGRLEEIEQHESYYAHIDTIKLNIILELKRDGFIDSEVRFADGSVTAGGMELMTLENIPPSDLERLKDEILTLDKQIEILINSDDIDLKDVTQKQVQLSLFRITKQMHSIETKLLRYRGLLTDECFDNCSLTIREEKAHELVKDGKIQDALTVLREKERKVELEKAKAKSLALSRKIQEYIKENRLQIDILKNESVGIHESVILSLYEECVELAEQYNVELDVLFDYTEFLYNQKRFKRAIEVGERLKKLYEFNPPDDWEMAELYNLLGMCYDVL